MAKAKPKREATERPAHSGALRFESFARVAPVGLFHTDAQGLCLYVNERWCAITGLEAAAARGPGWAAALHPEDAKAVRGAWREAVSRGEEFKAEYRFRHPDRREVWVLGQAAAERDEHGQVTGFVGSVTDITDRKQAEAVLVESEERYRRLVEMSADGIMIHSEERIVFCNPAFAALAGAKRPEELLGRSIWDLVPAEYVPLIRERLRRLRDERRKQPGIEEKLVRLDGTLVDVEIVGLPFVHQGRPAVQVIARDITRRKEAQASLRASEARFRRVVESDMAGIILWDIQGRITEANNAYLRMLGYSREDLEQGRLSWKSLTPPEHAEKDVAGLRSLMESGRCPPFEKEYLRKDGTRVPVVIGAAFLEGSTEKGVAFVLDITERRRAEESLRLSEERFRIAARATKDTIWDWDLAGGALWWGGGLEAVFGHKPEEIEPGIESWERRLHPEDKQAVIASIEAVIRSGGAAWSGEYRFRRADGAYAHVYDRGWVIHDAEGKPVRMVGAMMDISERTRLLAQAEEARDHLQQLSRRLVMVQEEERRRLARELHDEVGQQLTALHLSVEAAAARTEGEAAAALSDPLRLTKELINLLRNLSLDLRPTMLDDLGLAPALLWLFDRLQTARTLQVNFLHWGIEGRRFPTEIETAAYRIVQEALTNVARHARAGEAHVRVWADERSLCVQVEDAGAGFNADAALRAANSSGLSGMRERAALLGGRLTIESAPGGGATLTAELPLVENTPQQL